MPATTRRARSERRSSSCAWQTLSPQHTAHHGGGLNSCTDRTVGAALIEGATVYSTVDNTENKAGALNQYLRLHLLGMHPEDFVLVLDADSTVDPRFLGRRHAPRLAADPRLGAVGGVFMGHGARSLLEQAQANEYVRFARSVARKQGRVMVLTGTATIYRVHALLQVAEQRGRFLPGRMGDVYDTAALTEDNEITLALKHLGWRMVSPRECVVHTELMPTLGELHRQRLRWYRGAIENLRCYGWTPVTSRATGCSSSGSCSAPSCSLCSSPSPRPTSPSGCCDGHPMVGRRLPALPGGAHRHGLADPAPRRGRLLALAVLPEVAYDS